MNKRNSDNWFSKVSNIRHLSQYIPRSDKLTDVTNETHQGQVNLSLSELKKHSLRLLILLGGIWFLWGLMMWTFYSFQNTTSNRESVSGWIGLVLCSIISFVAIYYINLKLIQYKTIIIGSQLKIIFNNQKVIGRFFKLDYAILDKTGTLTEPAAQVKNIVVPNSVERAKIFSILELLEQESKHPVARGIMMYLNNQIFERKVVQLKQRQKVDSGVWGRFEDADYALLSRAGVRQLGIEPKIKADGMMMCYLIENQKKVIASIVLQDKVRSSATSLIKQIKNQRIVTVMATGDNDSNANQIGQLLGIDVIAADLTSQSKGELVKAYQQNGRVLFVGDGMNDYQALKNADFSIGIMHNKYSLGLIADVQIQADHLTLVQTSLKLLQQAIIKKWLSMTYWGFYWVTIVYCIQELNLNSMYLISVYILLGLVVAILQILNFKIWKTNI